MAAITWDDTGKRFYEMGVSKGVLYVQNSDGTYANGVAWNGLTSISESPDGAEANDLWADNIKYASLRSAETFGGTIEAYTYPDEWAQCDGLSTPVAGVQVGQQARKSFGLCYRTEVGNDVSTEAGYVLHLVWNATASPSERSYETINDSPDAITMSWEFDTTPVDAGTAFKKTAHIAIDTTRLGTGGAANLATLETMLYGGSGESANPTLPTPAVVLSTMGYTAPTPSNP